MVPVPTDAPAPIVGDSERVSAGALAVTLNPQKAV
jgi:hypothetical protein